MTTKPEKFVTGLLLVFNEEKFLDIHLSKLKEYLDYLVVVEGAVKGFYEYADEYGQSTDNTAKILDDWYSHGLRDRMSIVPPCGSQNGKWSTKHEMQAVGLDYVPEKTNYLHILDADEVYDRHDLELLRKIMREDEPDCIKLRMRHWGLGGILKDKGIFKEPINRIYKWFEGMEFKKGTMNVVQLHNPRIIIPPGLKCDHYGHIDQERCIRKQKYYETRDLEE